MLDLLLPVMVFIHGGAFVSGSGHKDFYGPQYFMETQVPFNLILPMYPFLNALRLIPLSYAGLANVLNHKSGDEIQYLKQLHTSRLVFFLS